MKDLLTIGEAAKLCGVTVETMREWEAKGKLSPQRTVGGHRRYSQRDIRELMPAYQKWTGEDMARHLERTAARIREKFLPVEYPTTVTMQVLNTLHLVGG